MGSCDRAWCDWPARGGLVLLVGVALLCACPQPEVEGPGLGDGARVDARVAVDSAVHDGNSSDAESADRAGRDAAVTDAWVSESGTGDRALIDGGAGDVGAPDSIAADRSATDLAAPDTLIPDSAAEDVHVELCAACVHGCRLGVCFPECSPQDPCCDADGFLRPAGEVCETWTEYRCSGPACGDDAESREVSRACSGSAACDGVVSDPPWSLLEDCRLGDQLCADGQGTASCTSCPFGCHDDACGACDPAEPCCDDLGAFRDTAYVCESWSELRCEPADTCGADPQQRDVDQHCAGGTSLCDGEVLPGPWSSYQGLDCAPDQACTLGVDDATCESCPFGCANGVCEPECHVADPCCGPDETYVCWLDPVSGLTWQEPGWTIHTSWTEARSHCWDLDLGNYSDWRLPSIDELRSFIRGCPDTEAGGSCRVTGACSSTSSCWGGACYNSCDYLQGPADNGCYWDPAIEGNCTSKSFWSSTVPSNRADSVWWVGFGAADLSYGDKDSTFGVGVRCVRGPD